MASSVACPGLRPLESVSRCVVVCGGGNSVVQMVRVVQTQSASLVFELLGGEAFQRGLRRNGHEDGEGHRPVGQMKRGCARFRDLKLSDVIPPELILI